MKNNLIIFFLLIPFIGCTQLFKESENYSFNDIEVLMTPEYFAIADSVRAPLVIKIREKSTELIKKEIEIFSAESYCGMWICEQEVTGYKNVKSVVRISYEYCGCCSEVYETTYLVKNDGTWIPLPEVIYHFCDYPEEKPAFHFELEQHPVVQEIQKVTEFRNAEGDLYKSETIETYLWNGKFIVKKED
jgi:hypothetical protein